MYDKTDLNTIDLNSEPPLEEPARQYYFMAKCREWVLGFERKSGRRPTSKVVNFGCQMNARDSEKLAGILEKTGFMRADTEEADFVIYNTCTVRENADNKVFGRLGTLQQLKKKNPHMVIALCGCMMQEKPVVEKIKASYRFVDLIFGTHNLYRFAELAARVLDSDTMVTEMWEDTDRKNFRSGGNMLSNPVSILCQAVIISAVTVLFRMSGAGSEAESPKKY